MTFRFRQVFLLCLLAVTSNSGGKTQNCSPKPVDKLNPHAGQNFVVNNNYDGLAKSEREMLAHIKEKVDYIAAQSAKVTCCLAFFHFFRLNNYHGVKILLNLSILDCFWNVHISGSPCPTGWVLYRKSCYLVIDVPTLEWNGARRNCLKLGGDLVKITTAAENQFILNLIIKQVSKVTPSGAWLGLHIKADSKFYWTDDTLLSGYKAWMPGEPNNPSGEKCSNIAGSGSSRGKWNDVSCKINKRYITHAPVILCQRKSN